MKIDISRESFPLKSAFQISRGSKTVADVVTVKLTRNGLQGWGECVPYARYGETTKSVMEQLRCVSPQITRAKLIETLPAGAARNALDCALWDLNAKEANTRVWQLANLPKPQPVQTAFTLSLDTIENMTLAAAENAHRPVLKLKLGTHNDLERLMAVRNAAPNAKLVIDANEGWTPDDYHKLLDHLVALGIALIEQPFPAGQDACLTELGRPIPICADESVHTSADLSALIAKYDCVNIKLDKSGGLTAAIELKTKAQAMGFDIMIGCMVGTSLAMAPALLLATDATLVDLDGPLLLAKDRKTPISYGVHGMLPAPATLWG
ncbi:MAG: N-acetyl-D-Glu racemase DgcA [Paracoccaceae bacterium]|nr:dipeptide epimerase [Paracoccaceae bacterium]